MSNKVTFVVLGEHTLCYIDPRAPLTGGILGASVIKGATQTWQDGSVSLPLDPAWVRSDACPKPLDLTGRHEVKLDPAQVRPATLADFAEFRVSAEGYSRDPARYLMPAA